MLPSFLFRFRHYLVVVIQEVLISRHEPEPPRSWSRVEEQTTVDEAPSRSTIRRWAKSFALHAPVWLAFLEQWLALQDSASPWLDPLGEALHAGSTPRALLQAAVHLLAWAQWRFAELRDVSLIARLSVLWQWGYSPSRPRLV